MKRIVLGFGVLMCVAAPAISQQLQQSTVPASKPAQAPTQAGMGPQLKQAQTQVPRIAADPSQRPQSASPIPSAGPAKQVPAEQTAPARKSPANLRDPTGKPVNGLIQVAPNRVYDPATGRYHWTESDGQQQKLMD